MATRYSSYRSYPSYKPRSLRKNENKAKNRLVWTIIFAVVFLAVFVIWGLPAFVGGLQIFNQNKNSHPAIVEDEAIAPPVLNIPFDATNSASIKITGYSTPETKVEIYFDDDLKTSVDTGVDGTFETGDLDLSLGRNNINGRTVYSDGKKSLPSKTIRLNFNNEKPQLQVDSPGDGQQIKGGDKKITVSGKTDPQNSIKVNGITVIVNGDGGFSLSVNLNDGDNSITVTVTDTVGNTTQIQKTVNYAAS